MKSDSTSAETQKKILVLVNGHSLAHVSRPLEIVRILRARGHEIVFAGAGKCLEAAAQENFRVAPLPFISAEQMNNAIQNQAHVGRLYTKEQLREFVKAELDLYRAEKPDLILVDCRITATTSAEILGIKTVGILNVHMSLYRKIPFVSLQKWKFFSDVFNKMENAIEFWVWDRLIVSKLAAVRKEYGLKRKYSYEVDEGDLALLADVPQFNPVSSLPSHARYIGPLIWQNQLPPPQCLDRLDPNKKCIFLNIGSEGLEELMEKLEVFARNDLQVVIAIGQAELKAGLKIPSNIFIEKFVNLHVLAPYLDLVVCHGGNGTIYHALSYGMPVFGMALHEEQHYCIKRMNERKLGIGYTYKQVKKSSFKLLINGIQTILTDPQYKENTKDFQKLLSQWHGPEAGASLVEMHMLQESVQIFNLK